MEQEKKNTHTHRAIASSAIYRYSTLIHHLSCTCHLFVIRIQMVSSSKIDKNIDYPELNAGKAILVRGRRSPYGCEMSRSPYFLKNRLTDGSDVSFMRLSRRTPPERFLVLISVRG
jgi:hypothetical protein